MGSGLGLSQVYGFARQSGGAVSIDSEVGKGTSITLILPRGGSVSRTPLSAPCDFVSATVPTRILLVEDNEDVARTTVELLRDFGLQVVWVRNAMAALAELEGDSTIEMVVSDIVMPGAMSGLELAQTLRERYPELPVVLATGYSEYGPQVVKEGFTLVEKPYRRETLAALLRTTASQRLGAAGARQMRQSEVAVDLGTSA